MPYKNREDLIKNKKAYYSNNRDASHSWRLKKLYKITLEEYDFLLEQQDGHCALCSTTPEENGKRLSVDHDHSCCPGKMTCGNCIRGLLCYKCNTHIEWYAKQDDVILDSYLGKEL